MTVAVGVGGGGSNIKDIGDGGGGGVCVCVCVCVCGRESAVRTRSKRNGIESNRARNSLLPDLDDVDEHLAELRIFVQIDKIR